VDLVSYEFVSTQIKHAIISCRRVEKSDLTGSSRGDNKTVGSGVCLN